MGAKVSVHQFGWWKLDTFSGHSSHVHHYLQPRKNQKEAKISTNNMVTSCKYQMLDDKTSIMADFKDKIHYKTLSYEASSLKTKYNEMKVYSTSEDAGCIEENIGTPEIQEQGQITLENQTMMGYRISKSQFQKCDAAGDAPTNQVSFRTVSNLGEHSMLGFSRSRSGDIIYTAFIRMKNGTVDEYEILKRTSARKIAGLENRLNCRIKLYEEAFKMRAQIVFKFEIRGSDYKDVLKCWNSLPKCIAERLVSADNLQELYF